jgi:biopolymer transport protein ExbD
MALGTRPRTLELEPLNLTPLLDVLFNLIFFFLLATTLREETHLMEVQIPRGSAASEAAKPEEEMVVTIGPDGSIFLNDDQVTSAVLKTRLSELDRNATKPKPVRIRSDQATPAQALVDVMSICHESGHPNIGLEVKPPTRGP